MPISPAPCAFCIRLIYCLETVFHVAMYFSMHCVKHVSSFFESELPGDGMHLSKQCMFSFCRESVSGWVREEYGVGFGVRGKGEGGGMYSY